MRVLREAGFAEYGVVAGEVAGELEEFGAGWSDAWD